MYRAEPGPGGPEFLVCKGPASSQQACDFSCATEMADVHVVVDNPARTYLDQDSIFFDRFLVLWPPQDENLFRVSEIKDINVSFLGQISSYRSYRAELIRFLIDAGVDGYFSTRDRAQQVTHEQYADVYARSFMSINFSASVSCDQFKSRILEIMYSGAMLLESENDQISRYFTPFVHYVPFTDKDDLLDKIAYYEAHPQERDRIARAGHDKAREQYNARHFWESIFLKAGVPVQPIQ
jgi:spore maturation protein CgeB